MNIKKSLIALSVFSILTGGVWEAAVAKNVDKEQDSVKRWGRWAVLSPAAGQEESGLTTIAAANDLGSCESSENCPGIQPVGEPVEPPPIEPPPPPPPPEVKSPCEAGMPCGFARVDVVNTESEPNSNYVAGFRLDMNEVGPEDEGTSTVAFEVGAGTLLNPNSTAAITSATENAKYYERAVWTLDIYSQTILRGLVTRDDGYEKVMVQGPWRHGSESGEYVWGITATETQIVNLKDQLEILQGSLSASYTGITGNGGTVAMQVNFGSDVWTGQFSGAVNFEASGDVIGSGFVSDAKGFSSNVAEGIVKGGFVNAGHNAIGGYEVVDVEGIKDADVFNAALSIQAEPVY